MYLDELDFDLPSALIAQRPLERRDASRLLVAQRNGNGLQDSMISSLLELRHPALLVTNDTRVIPARLKGRKSTGGAFELLLLEQVSGSEQSGRWRAWARSLRNVEPGTRLRVEAPELAVTFCRRLSEREVEVELVGQPSIAELLRRHGRLALPPYVQREADDLDDERYQTVYARSDGAIAAPTAGLHLTEDLLEQLHERGHQVEALTLHVGAGTFAPVQSATLEAHEMHEERYEVPERLAAAFAQARQDGRPVLAVGTTALRALEAAFDGVGLAAGEGRTRLLIAPPYKVRTADALLTNFHLPRSTLLALVMAFAGKATVRRVYQHAVAQRYRFFSYGDACLFTTEALWSFG